MVDLIIESDFSFLHVTQLFNFLRFGFVEKKIQSVSTQLCDHTDHYFPSPYSKKMSYIVFFPPLSLLNVLQDHLHCARAETLTTNIPEQLSPCWTRAHSYEIFWATAHGKAQEMLAPLGSSALLGAVDGWGLLGLTQSTSGSREGGITALLSYFFITLFLLLPYFSSTVMVLGHITQHFEFMVFSCLRPVLMPVAFLSPVESLWSFTSCVYLVCQFSFISHLSILLCHAMFPGLWNDASSSLHVSGFPC